MFLAWGNDYDFFLRRITYLKPFSALKDVFGIGWAVFLA